MTTTKSDRRHLLATLVGMCAVAVYASTVGYDFVYDDVKIILLPDDVHSLANWRDIITSPWWSDSLYRPFAKLSLALDWAIGGGTPAVFHAVNVLLHVAVTLAVFALARTALPVVGAFVAALIFAVHPVHVEAVANAVGRTELFAGLFGVVAALLYRRDGRLAVAGDTSWRRALAAGGTLGAVVLGLASKESAFAIPGILLLVDWNEARAAGETLTIRFRHHGVLWFATVALAIEWLAVRTLVVGGMAGDQPAPGLFGESLVGRTWVMAPLFLDYIRLLIFPLHLSADYSPDFVRVAPSATVRGLLGLSAVFALGALAVGARRRAPVVTFGLAWIGGTLLVVSNVLVPTGVLLAERSMYLPSVGFAFVVGWLFQWGWNRSRKATGALAVAVVMLATARTLLRVPVWRNGESFFPQLVQDAPGSFRGMWIGAMLLYIRGDAKAGEGLLRSALAVYPYYPNTWQDLAKQLQREQRWKEAAQAFAAAYRIDKLRVYDAAGAIANYARAGMVDSALILATAARRIDPHTPWLLAAMGDIAMHDGRPLEAMTWRRQAAWQRPDQTHYWYLTARAAIRAEYCPEVIRSVDRIRRIDPTSPQLEVLEHEGRDVGCES